MNWDAIGAMAELVGAAGVIASLLYLAAQIRASTTASRASAGEAALRAIQNVLQPLSTDAALTELYSDMFADFDALEGVARRQALFLMFQTMKAFETVHYHYARGMLDPITWLGWEHLLVNYVNTPGFRSYWELREGVYSTEFRAWIRENMKHADGRTAHNL